MFNRRVVVTDQNIFTENRSSAIPRIIMVNTILGLMAGTILWAVLERNVALENQEFGDAINQAPTSISAPLQVTSVR